MNNTGLILLSGGLDSFVSLVIARKTIDIKLALFFDYGQKAYLEEKEAVEKICKKYDISLEIIELPFLKKLSSNALTQEENNEFNKLESLWIPNRNGLFLNIGACYCDKLGYDYLIFGANKEEGREFSDNTKEFSKSADEFFSYSTLNKVKVFAPCVNFDKIEIVNLGVDNNVDFKLLKSCYQSIKKTGKKHCLECMSCKLLYNAVKNSKKPQLLEEIF